MYTYIYIYVYIYRERERDMYMRCEALLVEGERVRVRRGDAVPDISPRSITYI